MSSIMLMPALKYSTRGVASLVLVGLFSGCATVPSDRPTKAQGFMPMPMHASVTGLVADIDQRKLTTASRQLAAAGLSAMEEGQYEKANALFNLALKTDINNSHLHFLNGLGYHLRALQGEGSLYALAQQGYQMALQFDASNTVARRYLGLLYMDRRDFVSAKQTFMETALYVQDDPDLLYDLAASAYYAKDPRVAYAALMGLQGLEDQRDTPRVLKALTVVAAALGNDQVARNHLKKLASQGIKGHTWEHLTHRLDSWAATHGVLAIKTQLDDDPPADINSSTQTQRRVLPPAGNSINTITPQDDTNQSPQEMPRVVGNGRFFEKNMVMLDVVIVAAEEDNNDTFGVNLLDGLRIQFGNNLGTPAWSRMTNINSDLTLSSESITRQVTRMIQVPAISYTLNIANAQERRNEVLARPSLVALGGQTSTFFSGTDVIGAAVSTGQGGSVQVQKEAGVKLALTPEFLPDDMIKLKVVAERTFLTNPNSNVLFDFRLDTSKTLVSANVAMKFGETLILSGLSERNTESDSSGVPLLRDVPVAQYLFSRRTKRDFYKSVLILVTPRRPAYTNRSEVDIAAEQAKLSEFERVQAEFEGRFKLWFKPIPNTAQAIYSLESSPVFREFRSGDLAVESWTSRASHGGRLRSALSFLYY